MNLNFKISTKLFESEMSRGKQLLKMRPSGSGLLWINLKYLGSCGLLGLLELLRITSVFLRLQVDWLGWQVGYLKLHVDYLRIKITYFGFKVDYLELYRITWITRFTSGLSRITSWFPTTRSSSSRRTSGLLGLPRLLWLFRITSGLPGIKNRFSAIKSVLPRIKLD